VHETRGTGHVDHLHVTGGIRVALRRQRHVVRANPHDQTPAGDWGKLRDRRSYAAQVERAARERRSPPRSASTSGQQRDGLISGEPMNARALPFINSRGEHDRAALAVQAAQMSHGT
jgi:hypothetical protein